MRYVNEIVGGDGKRRYRLTRADGTAETGVLIEKDYLPLQEGSRFGAEEANSLEQRAVYSAALKGDGQVYTATCPQLTDYQKGFILLATFEAENTGAATIDINGLGAVPMKQYTSAGVKTDCIAGDFQKYQRYLLQYDGSDFFPVGASARAAKSGIWVGAEEPPADAGYALWLDPTDATPGELNGFGSLQAGDIPKFSGEYLVPAVAGQDYSRPLVGEIKIWPGDSPPEGYLLCDGNRLQGSDYPELYAAIGKTFGGDEFDSFWLPDLRGQMPNIVLNYIIKY